MNKRFTVLSMLIVVSLVFIFAFAGCGKNESNTSTAKKSEPAAKMPQRPAPAQQGLKSAAQSQNVPQWKMMGLDGKQHSWDVYKGKVVILDFWDTWCPPCKKEIPGFIELAETYKNEDMVILGAAFGRDGEPAVREFAKSWKINYPVLLADRTVNQQFGGIRSIPTTYVIDKNGKVRNVHVGWAPKSKFEDEIKTLLAEK